MHLVFTDLDGTLLNHDTYSWEAARPAIQRLKDHDIPWVFVTSKTRAEVEYWREATGNVHPFIIENGAAAYIPYGYFPSPPAHSFDSAGCHTIEWGTPYLALVEALQHAARTVDCRVRGFHDMPVEEVAESCGLDPSLAAMAKKREYDEPFLILDPARGPALVQAIEARGFSCTRGGRFWHITGRNDKGLAVNTLNKLFSEFNGSVISIGLGDGLNDLPLLHEVAIPVLMPSAQLAILQRHLPDALVAPASGPGGWSQMILSIISAAPGCVPVPQGAE